MIKLFDFYSSENAKRKEQEALAEQRRAQREAEELKKSKNGKKKSIILKILKISLIFTTIFIFKKLQSRFFATCRR